MRPPLSLPALGATTVSLTYLPTTSNWPCQIKAPGSRDWERTATRWLRELLSARYAGYPTLTRHPVLLARHAQLQLQQETRTVRTALHTARAELPALGIPDSAI
jgi:hypothetical protein